MAELFNVNVPAISKHLKNIFSEGELVENSVVSILENTASDGKKYQTKYYDLDAIIAVGYRVNSKKATNFRIWATETLKEYITKEGIVRPYFDVKPDSPIEDFVTEAPRHPVFRLVAP